MVRGGPPGMFRSSPDGPFEQRVTKSSKGLAFLPLPVRLQTTQPWRRKPLGLVRRLRQTRFGISRRYSV